MLLLLIMVILAGLSIGIAGASWKTIVQRSKEVELLWKGQQIQAAIQAYYENSRENGTTSSLKMFPKKLDDLIKDERSPILCRYLRQVYPDPMTGGDWELIHAANGGIAGVRSTSEKKPFQPFPSGSDSKTTVWQPSYRDWIFMFDPKHNKEKPTTDNN